MNKHTDIRQKALALLLALCLLMPSLAAAAQPWQEQELPYGAKLRAGTIFYTDAELTEEQGALLMDAPVLVNEVRGKAAAISYTSKKETKNAWVEGKNLILLNIATPTDLPGLIENEDVVLMPPAAPESTEEPEEQPTEEPTEEPGEEPTEEPTEEPAEGPAEESTEEPADQSGEEPTKEPHENLDEEPTEEPSEEEQAENAEEEPAEGLTEEPSEEPDEENSGELTEEPAEDSTEEAIDNLSEDESDEAVEKLDEESAESAEEDMPPAAWRTKTRKKNPSPVKNSRSCLLKAHSRKRLPYMSWRKTSWSRLFISRLPRIPFRKPGTRILSVPAGLLPRLVPWKST